LDDDILPDLEAIVHDRISPIMVVW
jgi:hypothetical protein